MVVSRFLDRVYERRFESLFAALVLFIFVPNFFSPELRGSVVEPLTRSILLITAYGLVWNESKMRRQLVLSTIVVLLAATWLVNHIEIVALEYLYLGLLILFFCHIGYEIINQIYRQDEVDLQTVMAVLCGYLVLGILGFFLFSIIYLRDSGAFNIALNRFDDLIYYTFITLTTIGYGDIAPQTQSARTASVLLGISGQFYTTVIIALIVGKFLQGKSQNQ